MLDRVIITMEAAARWRKARERAASRPPNRTAIAKILKRKYAGAVNLDTVVSSQSRPLKLSAQRGVHRNGTPATSSGYVKTNRKV